MLPDEQRARAVERLAHQVAACVHRMLALSDKTVVDLKRLLQALGREDVAFVDRVLAASDPHSINLDMLSDIAFALGFDWDFTITHREDAGTMPAPTADKNATNA